MDIRNTEKGGDATHKRRKKNTMCVWSFKTFGFYTQ
jgi:hypothetical protein